MLGVLLAGACTSMYMHIPRGTSLTCRISDPHHPTQGEGVSPQVECTHVVLLYRLPCALGIVVEKFFACAYGPPGQTGSVLGREPLSPRGDRGCDQGPAACLPRWGESEGPSPLSEPQW